MKLFAAGFGNGVEHDRAFGIFGAVIGREHFEFGDHVRVNVDRRGAVAARIADVRAVGHDVHRFGARAVARKIAQGALFAAVAVAVDADGFAVVAGLVVEAGDGGHAGQNFQEFSRAAPDHRKVLHLRAGDGGAFFAAV